MISLSEKIFKISYYYLFFLFVLITVIACKKQASESEAKKILKAFDYELLKLAGRIQDTPSYNALQTLISVENIPLPYFIQPTIEPVGTRPFVFSEYCGVYKIDTCSMKAVMLQSSDSIIIHFSDTLVSELPIKLILAEYSEDLTISNLMFPVRINASIYIGNKRVMLIDHTAQLDRGLPVQANLSFELNNYLLETVMNTRLRKKFGKLNLTTNVLDDGEVLAKWNTRARLGLTGPGAIYFKRLRMTYSMYPVELDIKVNNDAISRDAADYINEFTKHSRMFAYSQKDNRKLGEINLKNRQGSDKLDYAISFNDTSYMFIEDLLLSAKHILSVKK